MLTAAPVAAWIKTLDGRYLWANAAADRLMGQRVTEASTEDLYGAGAAEIREYEQAALRAGCDQRVQTVNGQIVAVQRFSVESRGGALIGAIAMRITSGA